MRIISSIAALLVTIVSADLMADIEVPMTRVDEKGIGAPIGKISIRETEHGAEFVPVLNGLPPGLHGFHVHQNPDCKPALKDGKAVAALAAGGHYDPKNTQKHGMPWGEGHAGDLPPLYVDEQGKATQPVLAPRLTLNDLKGKSLMIHAGGDNHADHPAPLGGGGARIACGVSQ